MDEGIEEKNQTGQKEQKQDRKEPVIWINFVTKSYQGNNTKYKLNVREPKKFRGKVSFTGSGSCLVGKRKFPSKIIVLKTSDNSVFKGKKIAFNLPVGSRYYLYLTDGRKLSNGDNALIYYMGLKKILDVDRHIIYITKTS